MVDDNFRKFLSICSDSIMEKNSKRQEQNFKGSFSTENLSNEILAEFHIMMKQYLTSYHDWLTENYNVLPKT